MMRGVLRLTGFIIKRERTTLLLWILCLVGITLAVPIAFGTMYGTEADRAAMAITMANPAMTAMVGPGYGLSNYTIGAMFSQMMLTFTVLAVAVMNIFLVIRQTRRDEERGRIEVLRSLPVGRLAALSATMIVAVVTNLLLGVLSGLGLAALGMESLDFAGSMLYGISLSVSGLFFAAAAALFAQLCVTSRGAMGYSFMAMGLFYMMRAGDIQARLRFQRYPYRLGCCLYIFRKSTRNHPKIL